MVDLDVWVRASPDNAERVVQALRAFGFDLPALGLRFAFNLRLDLRRVQCF